MTGTKASDTTKVPPRTSPNKRVLLVLVGGLALAGFFVWGFFTHRNRIFPYYLLKPRGLLRLEVDDPANLSDPLVGIPYVAGTLDPHSDRTGVILHDETRSQPGLNLWCSSYTDEAFLMDMRGNVVHEWFHPRANWTHVTLLPDGGLLGVARDDGLRRLDKDSRELWTFDVRTHHDLWVQPDGTIYLLARRQEQDPRIHPRAPASVDEVIVLSPDGEELWRFSVLEAVLRSPHAGIVPSVAHRDFSDWKRTPELDLLHTNHVEVFDGALADRSPLYAEGNILLSLRAPNAVLILDPTGQEILWLWGPNTLQRQHHPSLLPNGNILIFDNRVEASRVVEVDPLTNNIVWSWGPGTEFHTLSRGSCQRLANGNTLITESDKGYVHEVTPDGDVVWRFANPYFTPREERRGIWRMERLAREALPFLTETERR